MWGLIARAAAAVAPKAGKWVARQVLGAARATGAKTIGGAVLRTAAVTAGAGALTKVAGNVLRPTLAPAPTFGPQGPQGSFPAPQPREGVAGRVVSRILPGGMTGREFTAYGEMTDKLGRPIAVYPEEVVQVRGPRGYVVVNVNGERIAVQSRVAVKMGLYTPPPKPPITGADMRAIRRANSATKRVARVAKQVGIKCAKRRGC